jgi:hypothetical protein
MNSAWWRAAAGRSPWIMYQNARVPPHPGQSSPVVSLSRQVGGASAVDSVGLAIVT